MAVLEELISQIDNEELKKRLKTEIDKLNKQKKFGLVYEEHLPECTLLYDIPVKAGNKVVVKDGDLNDIYSVIKVLNDKALCLSKSKEIKEMLVSDLVTCAEFGDPIYPFLEIIDRVENAPEDSLWHSLIEADNYHALQLLEYLYGGKVDCIYIDPPYNKVDSNDWKYNCNYVDKSDNYRHSKWLSMIEKRLRIAKKLLNPNDSVLIVTIDEEEYLHLGCLLEEMFPDAQIQMITDVINPGGTNRDGEFSRVEEYLFICRFGNSNIFKTDNNMMGNTDETAKQRVWYAFNRGNNPRTSANPQFYPIYIDPVRKKIVEIGEAMSLDTKIQDFPKKEGLVSVFPINNRGGESIWRAIPETTREWVNKGYVKVSKYDSKNDRWTLAYIPSGIQEKIETEGFVYDKCEDGSLNIQRASFDEKMVSPRTVWLQKHHNATDYGATIVKNLIPGHTFPYPKSLYSTHDSLRFFVGQKPNALIVDFFAGSGTTLHAVNLLNAEDGGHRRCILVTNNEIGVNAEKEMRVKGFKPGDEEWEKIGIARYVTWPRTVASIIGKDINNHPLTDKYFSTITKAIEKKRTITQINYIDEEELKKAASKKKIISLVTKGMIGGKLITDDCYYVASEDLKITCSVLIDASRYEEYLEEITDFDHITNFIVITKDNKLFNKINKAIEEQFGTYSEKAPVELEMSNGFKTNAIYFKLGFLDKNDVALGRQFEKLLSLLWMKSGACGPCPTSVDPNADMVILPENNMAILKNEQMFEMFATKMKEYPNIQNVFLVTDYEPSFASMAQTLGVRNTYQLYRDYLDNFRINTGRK